MADPRTAARDAAAAFNTAHCPGTWVRYWPAGRSAPFTYGWTTSRAWVIEDHLPVVEVSGEDFRVILANVEPIPVQPDGIADDERELPAPTAAAHRVREFITAWGDGILDVTLEGHPLYARDLEALSRHAAKVAELVDDLFLVWSHEAGAWWGPGGRAYRHDITRAGRFTADVAQSHARTRTWPADRKTPPEVVIPAPPLAVLADPARIEAWTDEQIRQATAARIAERRASMVEVPL
ncbi:hypothetical protein [Verrucosispora sp. WMMC514]|uniref:hypothetical protein n=1 Tax=Verrucosispora sp. WMMC514 TaxID=3015156 RepID=UPI00248AE53D|nr:hypothetical protein [Verrucosispora sp. WMMC514]WBB94246.1 hypothetical protein O7597_15455 [Verrucosispora sp. WMMC514]